MKMKFRLIFVLLLCLSWSVQASTEYLSEKPYKIQVNSTDLNIILNNGSSFGLSFFRNVNGLSIQYGIGNNYISSLITLNKSVIINKFTPIVSHGKNYHYYDVARKLPAWMWHRDNIEMYYLLSDGENVTRQNLNKLCYGVHRHDGVIAFYIKDSCNPPVDIIYIHSNSYIINVSGGNQSLYNFTGTDVRNFDCDTVAPAKNTTYFDNIVAYYPFDCSGNGFSGQNNGTIYGAVYVAGKYGNALSFDGVNDYVDVGDVNAVEGIGAITIEAWVYPTQNNVREIIIAKDLSGQRSWFLSKSDASTDNTVRFLIGDGGGGVTGGSVVSTNNLILNQWSFITATYNKSDSATNRLKIYINGVRETGIDYVEYSSDIPATTSKLYIGARQYVGIQKFFNGKIDEVRIYNRALTAAEINASYIARAAFNNGTAAYVNITLPADRKCKNITLTSSEFYSGNFTVTLNGIYKTLLNIPANASGSYNCDNDNLTGNLNLTV